MVFIRSEKPICAPSRLSDPQRCLWNGSNVRLLDDGSLSSFQGKSSCVSPLNISLLQAIKGMMSLALCPQVVYKSLVRAALPPVYLLGHFPSLRHVQGSTPTGVFEGGCQPLTHFSLGFPFHFSLFVASSLNLSQSIGGHGWLLPPALSSWRLRLYRLHCLHTLLDIAGNLNYWYHSFCL